MPHLLQSFFKKYNITDTVLVPLSVRIQIQKTETTLVILSRRNLTRELSTYTIVGSWRISRNDFRATPHNSTPKRLLPLSQSERQRIRTPAELSILDHATIVQSRIR